MDTVCPLCRSVKGRSAVNPGKLKRRSTLPGGTFFSENCPAASTIALIAVPFTETVRPAGTVAAMDIVDMVEAPRPNPLVPPDPPDVTRLPLMLAPVARLFDGEAGFDELLHAATPAAAKRTMARSVRRRTGPSPGCREMDSNRRAKLVPSPRRERGPATGQ